jgi:hypothetical protein
VSLLQLLLVLASAVIFGSESRGTDDHILLCQIRESPNLGGQVSVFISPMKRVARLYPQALGLLRINYMSFLYNFGTNRIENTISNSSSIILCLSVAAETGVNFVTTVYFSRVYNFQFSYRWKTCSITSWFPRINPSAATHLPIHFLETAHMSQYADRLWGPPSFLSSTYRGLFHPG